MAQHFGLQIALSMVGVDDGLRRVVAVLRHGIDGQVAPCQVLFQRHIRRGMHHKAFIARGRFALSARQRVFLLGVGV